MALNICYNPKSPLKWYKQFSENVKVHYSLYISYHCYQPLAGFTQSLFLYSCINWYWSIHVLFSFYCDNEIYSLDRYLSVQYNRHSVVQQSVERIHLAKLTLYTLWSATLQFLPPAPATPALSTTASFFTSLSLTILGTFSPRYLHRLGKDST